MDIRSPSASSQVRVSIRLILLFQVSALFLRSAMEAYVTRSGMDSTAAKYTGASLGIVALVIFLAPLFCENWSRLRRQFARPPSWLRLAASSVTLGLLLWAINSQTLLVFSALDWLGNADQSHAAVPVYRLTCANAMILLLAIPVMSVLTPVVEEICSRGLILQSLLPKGRWRAVFISSVLFAILHQPETYPAAFLFGLFAAVQALNWRSLWGPIITHGTFNLLVEIDRACIDAFWLPGRIQWETGGVLQGAFAIFVLCLIGSCWLVSASRLGTTCRSADPTHIDKQS